MINKALYAEATPSSTLSKELISTLLETMDYASISFISWAVDILKVLKIRIDRGDKITDAVSGEVYTRRSFQKFVKTNFSSYIFSQVYDAPEKAEKVYFSLERRENGYGLVMSGTSKAPTYCWISSLSERFSLVYMIATKVVYIKNIKTGTYSPFISETGHYCRYNLETGNLDEIL